MAPLSFHSKTWLLWLAAALVPSLSTRNPIYLALALAALAWTYRRVVAASGSQGWGGFLRLGLTLTAVAVALDLLLLGGHGTTPLVEIPRLRWEVEGPAGPVPLIQLGGVLTLEAAVQGLLSGASLTAVLLAMAVFNVGVDHYQLLRSLPPFLHRSATVLSIALTFVPQLAEAFREIREAQALRGHRFRGLRHLAPIAVALLAEALERSITLAESMEARGYGATRAHSPRRRYRVVIALGLALIASGLVAAGRLPGAGLVVAGGAAVVGVALWRLGRQHHRTRYRREAWQRRDGWLAMASVGALGTFLLVLWLDPSSLAYDPMPEIGRPPFAPPLAGAVLVLAAPGWLGRGGR